MDRTALLIIAGVVVNTMLIFMLVMAWRLLQTPTPVDGLRSGEERGGASPEEPAPAKAEATAADPLAGLFSYDSWAVSSGSNGLGGDLPSSVEG